MEALSKLPSRADLSAIEIVTFLAYGECLTHEQINQRDEAREQRWRIGTPERLSLLVECLVFRGRGELWPSDARSRHRMEEAFGSLAPNEVTAAADKLWADKSDHERSAATEAARRELLEWDLERRQFDVAGETLLDALRHREFRALAIPAKPFLSPVPGTRSRWIPRKALIDPDICVVRYDDRIGVDGYRRDLPFEHYERKAPDWCRPRIEMAKVKKWLMSVSSEAPAAARGRPSFKRQKAVAIIDALFPDGLPPLGDPRYSTNAIVAAVQATNDAKAIAGRLSAETIERALKEVRQREPQ